MKSVCHHSESPVHHDIVNLELLRSSSRHSYISWLRATISPAPGPDKKSCLTNSTLRPLRTERTRSSSCIRYSPTASILARPKDQCSSIIGLCARKTCLTSVVPESVSVRSASGLRNAVLGLSNISAPHLDFQHFGPRCIGTLVRTTVSSSHGGRAQRG